jgi:hypothetical protein
LNAIGNTDIPIPITKKAEHLQQKNKKPIEFEHSFLYTAQPQMPA